MSGVTGNTEGQTTVSPLATAPVCVLFPHLMFSELVTVIGHEADDSILGKPILLQSIEDLADVPVHVTHRSVVAVAPEFSQLVRDRHVGPKLVP